MHTKPFLFGLICAAVLLSYGRAAQFSPTDITECRLWLEACDGSNADTAAGGQVSRWVDKSGCGADFVRVRGAAAPVLSKRAIGQKDVIEFRGRDILVSQKQGHFDFLHDGSSVSVFAVFCTSQEHPRKYMTILGSGGDDEKSVGFALAFNDSNVFHENNALAVQVSNGSGYAVNIRRLRGQENYALAPLRPNIVSYVFDKEEKCSRAFVFGSKIAELKDLGVFSSSASAVQLLIGAADMKGGQGFEGEIAEIIIYKQALNDSERRSVESYLKDKYDITEPPRIIRDKRCRDVELTKRPCAVEPDGTILALDGQTLYESKDGINWTPRSDNLCDPKKPEIKAGPLMTVTPKGTLVSCFVNRQGGVKLDYKNNKFNNEQAFYPVYSMRSLDGGRSWTDCQLVQSGYCGAIRGLITTKQGNIVLCVQKWDTVNERHITAVYVSDDQGQTYKCSEVDNGIGRGMHDGFFESTIAELSDGRIIMLGRTSLGVFWQSYSQDGGFSWAKPKPTNISAGGYPGYLLTLKSGTVVLVWNRFYPEGGEGDESLVGMASATWYWGLHRVARFSRELSIMFSKDDCKSWSRPLVLAEGVQDNIRLAYPVMMEIGEGDIYLWTGVFSTKINEKDFD